MSDAEDRGLQEEERKDWALSTASREHPSVLEKAPSTGEWQQARRGDLAREATLPKSMARRRYDTVIRRVCHPDGDVPHSLHVAP